MHHSPRVEVMSELRASLICALLAAIGPIALAIFAPALPAIAVALGAPMSQAQLTISLFFAGFALGQLVCGPLSDGLGRKPVLLVFLALFTFGSVLAAFAQSIEVMIAARVAQGLGAAVGVALSRAIVRDLFEGVRGARVQSGVSIVLAIGPTVAPYLGGLLMTFADWRAIFYFLTAVGAGAMAVVAAQLRETVSFDPSRIHLRRVFASYGAVLQQPKFLLPSLVIAGTSGTVYAQAVILPFVMIDQIGLSAGDFGLAMLMQPIAFILGSIVVRQLLARDSEKRLSAFGLVFLLVCGLALPLIHLFVAPSFWSIMLPIAVWGWGVAFILPLMTTAALDSFPANSGAAAAMLGFLQMGSGLVGGLVAGQFADPSQALFVITPAMLAVALVSWIIWARRQE